MIGAATRRRVRERAGDRCEYCGLHQRHDPWLSFHVEHVVAKKHGGTDDEANLALACQHCNSHKGANLSGLDPDTGALTPLFHPRRDKWDEHFLRDGPRIAGITPVGRTTAWVLEMSAEDRIELRTLLCALGELD